MASHPSTPTPLEVAPQKLTCEEGWDLILQLAGSSKGMYDEFGGVETYVQRMRSDEPLV